MNLYSEIIGEIRIKKQASSRVKPKPGHSNLISWLSCCVLGWSGFGLLSLVLFQPHSVYSRKLVAPAIGYWNADWIAAVSLSWSLVVKGKIWRIKKTGAELID